MVRLSRLRAAFGRSPFRFVTLNEWSRCRLPYSLSMNCRYFSTSCHSFDVRMSLAAAAREMSERRVDASSRAASCSLCGAQLFVRLGMHRVHSPHLVATLATLAATLVCDRLIVSCRSFESVRQVDTHTHTQSNNSPSFLQKKSPTQSPSTAKARPRGDGCLSCLLISGQAGGALGGMSFALANSCFRFFDCCV